MFCDKNEIGFETLKECWFVISDSPVISVLIPCYNNCRTIERAIDSVLCQKLDVPVEIVVSDDGSVDGSVSLVKGLESKIPCLVLVQSNQNAGVSSARNKALERARGLYLTTLDADDECGDGKLAAELLACKQCNDNAVAFSQTVDRFGDESILVKDLEKYAKLSPAQQIDALLMHQLPVPRDLMFHRELLGNLRYNQELHLWEDWDLLLRIMLSGGELVYSGHRGTIYHRTISGLSSVSSRKHLLAQLKILSLNKKEIIRKRGVYRYVLAVLAARYRVGVPLMKQKVKNLLGGVVALGRR